ncbi:MAG: hypothetical protein ABI333_28150 [bacterium]
MQPIQIEIAGVGMRLLVRSWPDSEALRRFVGLFAPGPGTSERPDVELVVEAADLRPEPVEGSPSEVEIQVDAQGRITYEDRLLSGSLELGAAGAAGTFRVQPIPFVLAGMLRLVLSRVLLRRGGLLLHASGVVRRGALHLFSGPSGSGKTTIASELLGGGEPFALDRVALRVNGEGRWTGYATPFSDDEGRGMARSPGVPVQGLHFIEQSPRPFLQPLDRLDAVRKVLQNAAIDGRCASTDALVLEHAVSIAERVACYRLRFSRDSSFWVEIDRFAAERDGTRT